MILTIFLFLSVLAYSEPESFYRDRDCNSRFEGIPEFRNTDGTYTDCLTPDLAIEYDFAPKWYECISQAGHYGLLNSRQPVCVLIFKSDRDVKYLIRGINFVTEYHRKPIPIMVID